MNAAANVRAFLDMIALSEGTSTNTATHCGGYDVIVTGMDGKPEVFDDFRTHPFAKRPSKVINRAGLTSNAAGRYQCMARVNGVNYWAHYRDALHLPDFGPDSQDKWAVALIRECHALELVEAGKIAEAVHACRSRWASLPGAGYGQHENDFATLARAYMAAGGTFA